MATWTTVPDSSLEPGKPIRSIDALALRDNPVAIAEGASGAPHIASDAAIDWDGGGVGSTPAVNWVGAKNALLSAGAIGTYAMARRSGTSTAAFGSTVAGSQLVTSGIAESGIVYGSGLGLLSGTWRCMGFGAASTTTLQTVTLWLRIS